MGALCKILKPDEYRVTMQKTRTLHILIYVLDFRFRKIAELSGIILDGSTYSVDATSDIRRTCNLTIIPTSSDFDVSSNSNIWIDKYVQIQVGIEDIENKNKIVYSNLGVYLINNPSRVYSATNHQLTISGIDLMAKLTGMRNGYLSGTVGGIEYQIPANSDIKGAIKSSFALGGFQNVCISDIEPTSTVPNDITISVGSSIYSMLKELVEINAFYQMYFDVNGIPYVNKIPTGDTEPIMVDDEIWSKTLMQYNRDISFEEVKNTIEVYGKTLDDGTTPYAIAQDINPFSPFYVNGSAGTIRIVLSGGEYENIYTTSLAQQRANYELYLRCRLQDQITITTVPIYWLDVNWLVEITLPNKQGIEETEQYVIKKIDTNVGINGTQTITLMKYYPVE